MQNGAAEALDNALFGEPQSTALGYDGESAAAASAAGGDGRRLGGGFKRRKKKKVIVIVVVLLVALFVVLKACSGGDEGMAMVTTEPLTRQEIVRTLRVKAPLVGTESVEVVSSLHSEVLSISVAEGDHVTKGQVLAVLDSEELSAEVERARAALESAEAAAAQSVSRAEQEHEAARRDYERKKTLYEEGAITQVDFEAAADALTAAERELTTARTDSALESARLDLEAKRKELDSATVKSPIDGTVTRVNIKVGRFADDTDDKAPMFVIEDLSQLQMECDISEYEIGSVAIGQEATITAGILGDAVVRGTVSRISPTGELKAGGNGERAVPVVITIDEQGDRLISGISGQAEIIVDRREGVFVVPFEALIRDEQGNDVIATVTEAGLLHLIPVTTGIESLTSIEISGEELTEGMQYVTLPPSGAFEGMQVMAVSMDGTAGMTPSDGAVEIVAPIADAE